jgi:phage portal protein BeeE
MGLMATIAEWFREPDYGAGEVERAWPSEFFSFDGNLYPYPVSMMSAPTRQEEIGQDFPSLVEQAYKQNGVVFACVLARLMLFAEARFQFRQLRSGRPGELFGNTALRPLENPAPGQTTGHLLAHAEQDASMAGNWFGRRDGNRIVRMRPDWTDILIGSNDDAEVVSGDLDAEVLGYVYWPGGRRAGRDPEVLPRDEVAHYAPIPDPAASYRGMSWLTPIIREIMADQASTNHKLKALEEGGVRNAAIKLNTADPAKFTEWVSKISAKQDGAANAYKRLYLAEGMDVIPLGMDLVELDFKGIQGAGETRIAAAAGVPPIIVGLSEGLSSATYSNYGQARRRFADGTMRPLWRNMAGALATIIDVPADAELWYDDRDIPFLQEDVKDAADIMFVQAQAIRTLVDGGFVAEAAVDAVVSGDLTRLEHTDLFSVQLQPPGTVAAQPSANGDGSAEDANALANAIRELARREPNR